MIQDTTSIDAFLDYLDPFLVPQSIQQQLPPSDVVGNIRFSHPTLYVFPGGQGDSALFGINGFNLLVDGGFSRKACFWDFSRHLDRLDAILITRISDDNAGGMSALLQRKTMSAVYPQIGHVFANLPHSDKLSEIGAMAASMGKEDDKEDEDKDEDSLLINVIEEGNAMLQNLQILNLQPQVCLRDKDNAFKPINLYHKVGHGKLDMYVINPSRDAKEIREFMERWNGENSKSLGTFKSGINVDGKELWLPLANLVSICALLVWFPDNPDDTITRLLFPGSTPQNKVLRGLDKLKELEFMQKPVCASRSMRQSTQPASEKKEAMKQALKMSSSGRSSHSAAARASEKAEKTDVSSKKSSSSMRSESRRTIASATSARSKMEDKTPGSPKRKMEDKAQKERKNQAAGQQIKDKASVLKREKPLSSVRSSAATRASDKTDSSSARTRTSARPAIAPSKTKKDASNKTKKEEVSKISKVSAAAASRKKASAALPKEPAKTTPPLPSEPENDNAEQPEVNGVHPVKSVMAGLAAVVSTATCAAAAVMAEPIQQMEEEAESIVEKHQLEEMERSPNIHKENEDDDIEPELQRIKDEDDIHEQEERQPDIPVVAALPIEEKLPIVESVKPTVHVKTPDEVEDLPEHEAVEPEIVPQAVETQDEAQVDVESSPTEEVEKKIALDLQEKETEVEKEDASPQQESKEAPAENNVFDPNQKIEEDVTQESEGAQEQRELSEVIVTAQQESMPLKEEDNEVDVSWSKLKAHIEKLKEVMTQIVSFYTAEQKSSLSLTQEDKSLNAEIETYMLKSDTLLSVISAEIPPTSEGLIIVKDASGSAIELTRKCMKLAIELIEAESDGAKEFMEFLHCEPDLILHCQEVESFCIGLLPAATEENEKELMEKEQSGTEDDGLVQENVSKEKDKSLNEMKGELS